MSGLLDRGYMGEMFGCDTSAGMLEKAASESAGARIEFARMTDDRGPYADASFDLILSAAVFHHIRPEDRPDLFRDVRRLLRPGGRFYVFEHNPYNPLAQWVVRRTPLDADAVLLRPSETRDAMRTAGFDALRTDHLMFVPPRWRWLRSVEAWLSWLPIGAQYVVSGSV